MFKYKRGQLLLISDAIHQNQLFLIIGILELQNKDPLHEIMIIDSKLNLMYFMSFNCNNKSDWKIVQDT